MELKIIATVNRHMAALNIGGVAVPDAGDPMDVDAAVPVVPVAVAAAAVVVAGAAKRARGEGGADLNAERAALVGLAPHELTIALRDIAEPEGNMNEATRSWVNRTLRPITGCLRLHFAGDVEAFLTHHGGHYSMSSFSSQKCKGVVGACGITQAQV
jgi:hypothetical protein